MEDKTIIIEALRSKGYCTADEYCKEKDEWRKIIMKAKEMSPHFEDVIYKLTVWCYETQQPWYPKFRIHDAMLSFASEREVCVPSADEGTREGAAEDGSLPAESGGRSKKG